VHLVSQPPSELSSTVCCKLSIEGHSCGQNVSRNKDIVYILKVTGVQLSVAF